MASLISSMVLVGAPHSPPSHANGSNGYNAYNAYEWLELSPGDSAVWGLHTEPSDAGGRDAGALWYPGCGGLRRPATHQRGSRARTPPRTHRPPRCGQLQVQNVRAVCLHRAWFGPRPPSRRILLLLRPCTSL